MSRTPIDRVLVAFRAKIRGLHYSVIDDDRVSVMAAGDFITISRTWEQWWDEEAQMDSVKTYVEPGEEDLYHPPRPLTFDEILDLTKDDWCATELAISYEATPLWLFRSKDSVTTDTGRSKPAVDVYVRGVGGGGKVSVSYYSAEFESPAPMLVVDKVRKLGWLLAELNYKFYETWGV